MRHVAVTPGPRYSRHPALEMLERRELLSIWTVNTTADTGTGSVTNHTGDLRFCITQADSDATTPTIDFAISGTGLETIKLGSALPQITQPVTIDGTSQTGYKGTPLIEIDGSNLADTDAVLSITAGSTTIKALAIDGCPGTGILLTGAASGLVQGCYIGTPDGTTAKGNGTGIVVYSSSNVTIGGTATGQGNLISGSVGGDYTGNGYVGGGISVGSSSTGTVIQGNIIGLNASGTGILPNSDGVDIQSGASGTIINGGNVISGNTDSGIALVSGSTVQTGVASSDSLSRATSSARTSRETLPWESKPSASGLPDRITTRSGDRSRARAT